MKRISCLIILSVFLFLPLTVTSQSINLTILGGLNSIDFSAFTFTNGLAGTPKIFQVDILAPESVSRVIVGGNISWKKNDQSGFVAIVNNFSTEPIILTGGKRTFTNDELGNSIKIRDVDGNRDIAEEIIKMGKPVGLYRIELFLYDEMNNYLGQTFRDILFLNPASTISISSPQEGSSFDVGNVVAAWNQVVGAEYYTIRACAFINDTQGVEDVLRGSDPLINDRNVGNVTIVNLTGQSPDREWPAGKRIALEVTAHVAGPGGGTSLKSTPVTFRINESGGRSAAVINPDYVRLGNFLTSRSEVPRDFVTKLIGGQIEVDQITDENGTQINLTDFLNILSFWEAHMESIISINFLSR